MAMDLTATYRALVLGIAGNPTVRRLLTVNGRRLALRFVAGETIADALRAADRLHEEGVFSTLNLLGEGVADGESARRFKDQILELVDAVADRPWARYVSVKLTALGVDIGEEFAFRQLVEILERARLRGCFIRIDMEDSTHVDVTLRLYRRLRAEGYDHVGIVLQGYLRRSEQDLESLLPLRPNIRVVKGAYREPAKVAFPAKKYVDENYVRLARRNLGAGNYTAIATHDERIIDRLKAWTSQASIGRDLFEFQMLYGVRPDLLRSLVRQGYTARAYVPYGQDWYGYFARRIAERPENLFFVLRGLLRSTLRPAGYNIRAER